MLGLCSVREWKSCRPLVFRAMFGALTVVHGSWPEKSRTLKYWGQSYPEQGTQIFFLSLRLNFESEWARGPSPYGLRMKTKRRRGSEVKHSCCVCIYARSWTRNGFLDNNRWDFVVIHFIDALIYFHRYVVSVDDHYFICRRSVAIFCGSVVLTKTVSADKSSCVQSKD
jgi:hypothetical protein